MTLYELIKLMRHYWKLIVGVTLSCAFAAALISLFVLPHKYEASATITASDPSGTVPTSSLLAVANNLVQSEIEPYLTKGAEMEVSAQVDTSLASLPITITAEGSNEEECVEFVNAIASEATTKAIAVFQAFEEANKEGRVDLSVLSDADDVAGVLSGSLLQDVIGTDRTFEFCSFWVTEATHGEESGPGMAVLTLLAFFGGLLASILVVIGVDLVKKPIIGRKDVEELTSLPVLNGPFGGEACLWANVTFAAEGSPRSLAVVPLSHAPAQLWAERFVKASASAASFVVLEAAGQGPCGASSERDGAVVTVCPPLSDDAAAVYCAHDAQCTVVLARLWRDSLGELDEVLRELALAQANVIGVVLVD